VKPFIPGSLPIQLDWESLIPSIGAANRALASFNGALFGMPNAELLLSPLTTQEAVLSSKIEGTQATFGEVLKYEAGEQPIQEARRLDIQEILNYRTALKAADDELRRRPFNLNLLLALHSVLLDSVRGRDKARGRFRTVQNWIGRPGSSIREAIYIPPEPGRLRPLLDNWEKYYHADRPDPLVQLAMIHGQFEIIHPFIDGNGRIGRILIPLFLYEKGLLSRPVFYLSAYIESHKEEYISALDALSSRQDGAWNRWVEFFLKALTQQAQKNLESARSIIGLYERSKAEIIRITHSRYAVPLLDLLFRQPIFSPAQLERHGGVPSKQMTMSLLGRLKDAGILVVTRESSGRRPQILAFAELVNLCEGHEVIRRRKAKPSASRKHSPGTVAPQARIRT
jgi:Fic family protein